MTSYYPLEGIKNVLPNPVKMDYDMWTECGMTILDGHYNLKSRIQLTVLYSKDW